MRILLPGGAGAAAVCAACERGRGGLITRCPRDRAPDQEEGAAGAAGAAGAPRAACHFRATKSNILWSSSNFGLRVRSYAGSRRSDQTFAARRYRAGAHSRALKNLRAGLARPGLLLLTLAPSLIRPHLSFAPIDSWAPGPRQTADSSDASPHCLALEIELSLEWVFRSLCPTRRGAARHGATYIPRIHAGLRCGALRLRLARSPHRRGPR